MAVLENTMVHEVMYCLTGRNRLIDFKSSLMTDKESRY